MTFDSDQTLPPDQIGSALAGDAGGDVQFQQMKLWLPQYIAVIMSRARLTVGAGVALSEGLNQSMIYEP
jgi:hypothetical protein